jgi:hypothetical protein
LKVGDYVRLTAVPPGLPNPETEDLHTKDIFQRCLGHVFRVAGFQGEWLELEVGEVTGEPAYMHSIWVEPDFVELVGSPEDR